MLENKSIFIVGCPKAGTTYVERLILRDLQAYSLSTENHFLSSYVGSQDFHSTFSELLGASIDGVFLNKAVWNLYDHSVIQRIKKNFHNPYIIIMGRNPADLFFSKFDQLLYSGKENQASSSEAWQNSNGCCRIDCEVHSLGEYFYLDYKRLVRFGDFVGLWKESFGEKCIILDYDDFKSNMSSIHEVIGRFIGEQLSDEPLGDINVRKVSRSEFVSRLIYNPKYSALRQNWFLRLIIPNGVRKWIVELNKRQAVGDYTGPMRRVVGDYAFQSYEAFLRLKNEQI